MKLCYAKYFRNRCSRLLHCSCDFRKSEAQPVKIRVDYKIMCCQVFCLPPSLPKRMTYFLNDPILESKTEIWYGR